MTVAARNRRTVIALVGVICIMGMAVWASVPLYDWFCRVTGFAGSTIRAQANDVTPVPQSIKVRFDASVERGMPWRFKPAEREVEIRIGDTALTHYTAFNPTGSDIAGSASYNVFPFAAGAYFVKIDCFCFQQQVLGAGQQMDMPVSFYVDPGILDDPETRSIGTVTLSYTFHRIEIPDGDTAQAKRAGLLPVNEATFQDG